MNPTEYTLTTATLGLQGRYSRTNDRPTIWAYDPPISIPFKLGDKNVEAANADIYVQPFDLHGTAEEILRQYVYHGIFIVAGMVTAGEGKDQETELARLMALYPGVQQTA